MVRLRATGRYRNAALGLFYEPGEEFIPPTDELAAWLMHDSPGTFEVVERAALALAALDGPPADRMLRRERAARKDRDGGEAMSRATMRGLARD